MQEKLIFMSDGLKLSGVLHLPDKRSADIRLPAFLVLHGFVGSKDESHARSRPNVGGTWLCGLSL